MVRNPPLVSGMFHSCCSELTALGHRAELSSFLDVNQLLTKSFLLSCASFYEDELVKIVGGVVGSGDLVDSVSLWINSVAVNGQFYKWFNFRNTRNANPFFSMFGQDFKSKMRLLIDTRDWRIKAESDFIELCQKRNESVHRNYAAYSLDLTIDEIYEKHRSAMKFIRIVEYGTGKWLTRRFSSRT